MIDFEPVTSESVNDMRKNLKTTPRLRAVTVILINGISGESVGPNLEFWPEKPEEGLRINVNTHDDDVNQCSKELHIRIDLKNHSVRDVMQFYHKALTEFLLDSNNSDHKQS